MHFRKSSKNATQILLDIYRQEDVKCGVNYVDGVLINKNFPLNPKDKKTENITYKGSKINFLKEKKLEKEIINIESDSLAIMIKHLKACTNKIDLRRVVFSILYRTGFEVHNLSKEDEQLMILVKEYPQLRNKEIWTEVKYKLVNEKTNMTSEDEFFLDNWIKNSYEVVEKCVELQNKNLKILNTEKEEDLQKFYELIKSQKKYIQ